jgi:hypothetical protein
MNCNSHPRATVVSLIKNAKQKEFQVIERTAKIVVKAHLLMDTLHLTK